MNYNQFYRRKDKYKRKITQSEKKNAQRLGISFGKSILAEWHLDWRHWSYISCSCKGGKMELNKTIQNFKEQQKKMHAFDHVMNLLTYDAATGMPPGASDTLSDTLAVMSGESYRLTVSEEYKAMLKVLNEHKEELDFQTRREAEELLEEQEKAGKGSGRRGVAAAKAQNEANHYWEIAKNKNDYELFKPYLAKLIEIQKRYAGYINPDGDVYDTLLNEFEKGMTQKQMDPFFDDIKEKLVPLIAAVQKSSDKPDTSFLSGTFPIEKQKGTVRLRDGPHGYRQGTLHPAGDGTSFYDGVFQKRCPHHHEVQGR